MYLIREVQGREAEMIENVEALVLLLHNPKG